MATSKPTPPAPVPATVPPPAPTGSNEPAVVEVNPALTGVPIKGSPAGIILDPDIPAPIPPPYKEGDLLPKEGQPSHQGSLTPEQVDLKNRERIAAETTNAQRNPAMRSPTLIPLPPEPVEERIVNEDGFVAGAEVTWDQLRAHQQKNFVKPQETSAKDK